MERLTNIGSNGEIWITDDTYDKDEEVLSYEKWSKPEDNIQNGLTVVVKNEEVSRQLKKKSYVV